MTDPECHNRPMSARVRWWILIVALGGLAVAVESSWVHYRVLTDPTYVSPCDLNRTFSCSEVYLSRFGTVAGVPVALGGVSWFALVALVAAFARPGDRSSASGSYLFLLSIAGLAVVLYLAYVSSFVLHTYCVLCLATYACVLAIFALAMSIPEVPLRRLPRQLLADIRRGASRPVVIAASLLYLGGTGSFVALFPREVQAPGTTSAPDKSAEEAFREQWSKQ